MKQKLVTTQQAADAVKITRATLQAWIANGKFTPPAMQEFGRIRLWKPADIRRLAAKKEEIYQEKRPKK